MRTIAIALTLLLLSAAAAHAQQGTVLRMAVYLPEDHPIVRYVLFPYARAVNNASDGRLSIQVIPNGWLGPVREQQMSLVEQDMAEMALIRPSDRPRQFPDDEVFHLPLFDSALEGSRVAWRLHQQGMLRGYDRYHVISLFTTAPMHAHAPDRAGSLQELQGRPLSAPSGTARGVLARLGLRGSGIPLARTEAALRVHLVAGALADPRSVIDAGAADTLRHHYTLKLGVEPMALIMDKARYRALPGPQRDQIDAFGGERLAAAAGRIYDVLSENTLRRWQRAPDHRVSAPSEAELRVVEQRLAPFIQEWQQGHRNGQSLYRAATRTLETIRAGR